MSFTQLVQTCSIRMATDELLCLCILLSHFSCNWVVLFFSPFSSYARIPCLHVAASFATASQMSMLISAALRSRFQMSMIRKRKWPTDFFLVTTFPSRGSLTIRPSAQQTWWGISPIELRWYCVHFPVKVC